MTNLAQPTSLLTCIKAKFQVFFTDDQDHHGNQEKEEGKGQANRAFTPLLRAEVVAHHHEKDLAGEKILLRELTQGIATVSLGCF